MGNSREREESEERRDRETGEDSEVELNSSLIVKLEFLAMGVRIALIGNREGCTYDFVGVLALPLERSGVGDEMEEVIIGVVVDLGVNVLSSRVHPFG
jgi:hypothetical protein